MSSLQKFTTQVNKKPGTVRIFLFQLKTRKHGKLMSGNGKNKSNNHFITLWPLAETAQGENFFIKTIHRNQKANLSNVHDLNICKTLKSYCDANVRWSGPKSIYWYIVGTDAKAQWYRTNIMFVTCNYRYYQM